MALLNKITRVYLCKSSFSFKKIIGTAYESHTKSYVTDRQYETIKVEVLGSKSNIGLIQLHRPKALNALNAAMLIEVKEEMRKLNADKNIVAVVITGNNKAFAAGVDVKEMKDNTYSMNQKTGYLQGWEEAILNCHKPIIAAVNGLALGGGCELAMLCDIIYAGNKAKFAQLEVTVGTVSGGGGTQRLPRYVGKSKAMEMILSGKVIDAQEAENMGLVSRVFPEESLLENTLILAEKICTHSPSILNMVKQAVNHAYDSTLESGLQYERNLIYRAQALPSFAERNKDFGMRA